MSAYVVHKDLIDLLVTVSTKHGQYKRLNVEHQGILRQYGEGDENALGQLLIDANYASVNYRYDGYANPYEYRYNEVVNVGGAQNALIPWSHVLKAISCYEYQACEYPEWKDSIAKSACDAIRLKVCRFVSEDAPWDWTRAVAQERFFISLQVTK